MTTAKLTEADRARFAAHCELPDIQVAEAMGISRRAVRRYREKWCLFRSQLSEGEELRRFEAMRARAIQLEAMARKRAERERLRREFRCSIFAADPNIAARVEAAFANRIQELGIAA